MPLLFPSNHTIRKVMLALDFSFSRHKAGGKWRHTFSMCLGTKDFWSQYYGLALPAVTFIVKTIQLLSNVSLSGLCCTIKSIVSAYMGLRDVLLPHGTVKRVYVSQIYGGDRWPFLVLLKSLVSPGMSPVSAFFSRNILPTNSCVPQKPASLGRRLTWIKMRTNRRCVLGPLVLLHEKWKN